MSQFKVGDVCEIVNAIENRHLNGLECIVIEGEALREVWRPPQGVIERPVYTIEIEGVEYQMFAEHSELRLKRPPSEYDGNKAGEWDLIPWQPNKDKVTP